MESDVFQRAQRSYELGDLDACRADALQAVQESPRDVERLRLLARCSLALDDPTAAEYFRTIAQLQPEDVGSWRDLGAALLVGGDLAETAGAFRQVVRLRPDDTDALVDLAHVSFALGSTDEAIELLSHAVDRNPSPGALRGLGDMYRRAGRLDEALETAYRLAALQPDDVLATMDIADLSRALDKLDDSSAAFRRLRSIDDEDHDVYALHGMIEIEMDRGEWRRGLDLAIDATRIDRYSLTTELLSFISAQLLGAGNRPVPTRSEVEAALAAERADHRALHTAALDSSSGGW